jgi:cytochrome c peroxidase
LEAIDFLVQEDRFEMARQAARLDITPLELSDAEVMQIVAFLQALTGEGVENARFGVPHDFVE